MLVSEDKDFIKQTRFLSQQARDDAPHYEHSQIGFNYRMSNILAAIGRGQLKVLDDRVEAKRQIFEKYKEALKDVDGIEFMSEAAYGRSNRWITVILITPHKFGVDREQLANLRVKLFSQAGFYFPDAMECGTSIGLLVSFLNCHGMRDVHCAMECGTSIGLLVSFLNCLRQGGVSYWG